MSPSRTPDDDIDEANDESFPASDPPAWSGTHAGPPDAARGPGATTLRTVSSRFPVDEAMDRIERAVIAAGFKVFARIDQAAEARAVGLTMRPAVVLLFGNPKGGTPLMVARPTAAIDLPLKALVWQDEHGQAWLTYNTPALLVERHGIGASMANTLAPAGTLLEKAIAGAP